MLSACRARCSLTARMGLIALTALLTTLTPIALLAGSLAVPTAIADTTDCPDAGLEPDDSPDAAHPIEVDVRVARAFCAPDDEDYMTVALAAGTRYRFETFDLGEPTVTILVLVYQMPDGGYITLKQDGEGEGNASRFESGDA